MNWRKLTNGTDRGREADREDHAATADQAATERGDATEGARACEVDREYAVVGFRCFGIKGKHSILRPVSYTGVDYTIGANTAECRDRLTPNRNVAGPGHTCGFWVYNRLQDAVAHADTGGLWCTGAVVCWGQITEHALGFRAEHMEIMALGYSNRLGMRKVAEHYGVPLMIVDDLVNPKMCPAYEHGIPISQVPQHCEVATPPPPPPKPPVLVNPPGWSLTTQNTVITNGANGVIPPSMFGNPTRYFQYQNGGSAPMWLHLHGQDYEIKPGQAVYWTVDPNGQAKITWTKP